MVATDTLVACDGSKTSKSSFSSGSSADAGGPARTWLAASVGIDDADVVALAMNQRLALYQAAIRIALNDEELGEEERVLLDRIRDALGVSAEQALATDAEMPRHD